MITIKEDKGIYELRHNSMPIFSKCEDSEALRFPSFKAENAKEATFEKCVRRFLMLADLSDVEKQEAIRVMCSFIKNHS